jgi:FkbM family methyltransferase
MNKTLEIIRRFVRSRGYDVKRYVPEQLGVDPFQDMCFFMKAVKCPIIFDVGANRGQTVDRFKKIFQVSSIHSFEPSPRTFAKLNEHCNGLDGVKTWHCGVGSRQATLPFLENDNSDMSSFLAPGELCWGKIAKKTNVRIIALDSFVNEQDIEFVHILKSDTQGYDFEVFKGAEGLMRENRIGMIYFEFIFSNLYKDLPSFHEVFRFLSERNFSLVCFYKQYFQKNLISWTDLLFINLDYYRRFEQANAANAAK